MAVFRIPSNDDIVENFTKIAHFSWIIDELVIDNLNFDYKGNVLEVE